jgi:hypothetical protein
MNRTRLIRFAQSRSSNGVLVRAAGLMLRPSDAVLILAARLSFGDPVPLDLGALGDIIDDRSNRYEATQWETRFVLPTTWFFIQIPRPATDARRLQLRLDELTCVPTAIKPDSATLTELIPYTTELFQLPPVRHIPGPWDFDLPLRRHRTRMSRD